MRILIINDEPLAQTAMESILARSSDGEGCESANDAIGAPAKSGKNSNDVLLLDMPEVAPGNGSRSGLTEDGDRPSLAASAPPHNGHFKPAVDHGLRPFSADRIRKALDVEFRRTAEERAARLAEALPQLRKFSHRHSTRIAIKANGRIIFIDLNDVVVVEAEGNYVLMQRRSDSYLLRESISSMAEKLKPYGFIRIHRSVLVNSSFVEHIQSRLTGAYGLRIKGGKEYTVTRSYKSNLKSLATAWIGTDIFLDE